MFVGHLAVALAAKPVAPRAPLGALVAGAFGLDLIWPVLLLLGVERVRIVPGYTAFTPLAFDYYPWSHSLSMALVWAIFAGRVSAMVLKNARAGLVIGVAVASHWVLDFVTHVPDLPLWPGGPRVRIGPVELSGRDIGGGGCAVRCRDRDLLEEDGARQCDGYVGVLGVDWVDDGDLEQRTVVSAAPQRHRARRRGAGDVALSALGRLDRTQPILQPASAERYRRGGLS